MADENSKPATQASSSFLTSPQETRRSSVASGLNHSQSTTGGQASSAAPTDTSRRRPQPAQQQTGGYGSFISESGRQPAPSGDQASRRTSKKPGFGRRSSSMNNPHRGQGFSVDDAKDEVEEEYQTGQRQAKHASGTLKRVPSTLRRRPTAQAPVLPRVESHGNDDMIEEEHGVAPVDPERSQLLPQADSVQEADTLEGRNLEGGKDDDDDEVEEEEDLSDAESFTLKDRQEAINETHPFGIRIWKPALYKKDRSVQKTAEGDIHSSPGGHVSSWLMFFNILWTVLFGWWLALASALGGLICLSIGFAPGCADYGKVLWGLSGFLLYPFGKYVKLSHDEAYLEEDEGEGRSISEYEQWQSGDIEEGRLFFGPLHINRSLIGRRRSSVDSAQETDSLLGRTPRGTDSNHEQRDRKSKRRLFGRGQWNFGRVTFFVFFYGLITPLLFLASGVCWLLVFSIPMGKVTLLLWYHMRRHPLAISFHSESAITRGPGETSSSILLCTYRAVGIRYWKYTIDGTNIFLINLLSMVVFVIFDYWVLKYALGITNSLTASGLIFTLALFSTIPLAYFIGQAVASISAQSSMGVGATINAFFSTVVEVFLYCIALNEGKAQLVEGSIIGSIFAGVLLLPGISMCFGALKRKTQRFNVKSAGVTSTMLLFAVIGAFGPTLFYQIYGSHELNCHHCVHHPLESVDRDCRRCYFTQAPAVHDRFYIEAVRPYTWFAAALLFLSYVIGLLFTLRTHAAVIWNSEIDEKRAERLEHSTPHLTGNLHQDGYPVAAMTGRGTLSRQPTSGTLPRGDIRESQLYKRILGHSLKQVNLEPTRGYGADGKPSAGEGSTPGTRHIVPSNGDAEQNGQDSRSRNKSHIQGLVGLSEEDNQLLVRQVAEIATTAATIAARDATRAPHKASILASTPARNTQNDRTVHGQWDENEDAAVEAMHGGHDAPNWSRTKSAVILLTATVAYAIIAEVLVNTVDSVLKHVDIDEKFLGITLFALVPNATEFLNAISFAMNGNIALSMEIGSAYALQVCLLQIPALVLFSALYGRYVDPGDILDHTFTLIFPQWDMVTVILCVFLLSYMYGEGKSNYFKGSILILSYLVVLIGFYFSGFNNMDVMGIDKHDTLAFKGQVVILRVAQGDTSGVQR